MFQILVKDDIHVNSFSNEMRMVRVQVKSGRLPQPNAMMVRFSMHIAVPGLDYFAVPG